MSEYVASAYQRRAFLSSFTGSAGTAVVPLSGNALLWTDGRYFEQALSQLPVGWQLMRDRLPSTPSIPSFLSSSLPEGGAAGIDGSLLSHREALDWSSALEASGRHLRLLSGQNLVDAVWGASRPPRPASAVCGHPDSRSGASTSSKLERLRSELRARGAAALLLTALDEVAWALNIRGSDVPCCPVALGYVLVVLEGPAEAFLARANAAEALSAHFEGADVRVRGYDEAAARVREVAEGGRRVWLDPDSCNAAMAALVPEGLRVEAPSPVALLKAVKNRVEMDGMREAHRRDGAALARFFCWLERAHAAAEKETEITECSAAEVLRELRARERDFVGLSFDTIAGFAGNGAIIHYKPEPESCADMKKKGEEGTRGVFLLDSGGQYLDGTTDVTRTVHLGGAPDAHVRRCFTRVLQGFVALSRAVFPPGTTGYALDALARGALWREGLNYLHGTGHGVGAYLNVHEGPHGISFRKSCADTALQPGMTVTNEPGYYETGNFGIRIENVMAVVEVDTEFCFPDGAGKFLGFEQLTVAPIEREMMAVELLSAEEKAWIDQYHRHVLQSLTPLLEAEPEALQWLAKKCEPIQE